MNDFTQKWRNLTPNICEVPDFFFSYNYQLSIIFTEKFNMKNN